MEVACDRVGGCLKEIAGPDAACQCDHFERTVEAIVGAVERALSRDAARETQAVLASLDQLTLRGVGSGCERHRLAFPRG